MQVINHVSSTASTFISYKQNQSLVFNINNNSNNEDEEDVGAADEDQDGEDASPEEDVNQDTENSQPIHADRSSVFLEGFLENLFAHFPDCPKPIHVGGMSEDQVELALARIRGNLF